MENPRCPAMIPIKKTNVTPSETPKRWSFPNPNPIAVISDNIMTACKAEFSKNKSVNHSMPQIYTLFLRNAYIVLFYFVEMGLSMCIY